MRGRSGLRQDEVSRRSYKVAYHYYRCVALADFYLITPRCESIKEVYDCCESIKEEYDVSWLGAVVLLHESIHFLRELTGVTSAFNGEEGVSWFPVIDTCASWLRP